MKSLNKLLKNPGGTELWRNFVLLLGGNGLAQIITIIVTPFISRLFLPSAFGQLAFFMGIHGILVIMATGRYELAVVMPKKDSEASDLVSTGIMIAFLVSVAAAPVVLLLKLLLHAMHADFEISSWFYLLGIPVFTAAYAQLQNGWCVRNKNFKVIVIAAFLANISVTLFRLFFGYLRMPDGLLYAFLITQLVVAVFYAMVIRKGTPVQILRPGNKEIFRTAGTYTDFPKFNLPVALLNSFSGSLPVYFLVFYFSDRLTGQFSMAFALLFKAIILYNNSVYQILYQKAMEMKHQAEPLWPLIRRYIIRTLLMALAVSAIALPLFPALIRWYLGQGWEEAGVFCQLLLPWAVMLVPAGSLSFIPNIFHRQSRALALEIIYLVLRLAALFTGSLTGHVLLSVGLFSLSGFLMMAYRLLWYRRLLKDSDTRLLKS
jgi:O-antigen/teichoic acid export membrane protein